MSMFVCLEIKIFVFVYSYSYSCKALLRYHLFSDTKRGYFVQRERTPCAICTLHGMIMNVCSCMLIMLGNRGFFNDISLLFLTALCTDDICCNGKPYDIQKLICCDDELMDRMDDGECCGKQQYNSRYQICCGKTVSFIQHVLL